jgi:NAD(P)-dependent dehydrogenase (short-subunit alcohol dehydrogenase family)
MSLAAKTALLTGGRRGSGRATSLRPAACGAALVVNVFRKREAAEATADAVRKRGVQAWTVHANVSEPAAIDRLCAEIVAAAGGMDIVVSR